MSTPNDSFLIRTGEYVVNLILRGLIGLVMLLPYRIRIPLMGRVTARIVAPLAGYSRRIRQNLAHVCPELPANEVQRITRRVADNTGRNMIEMYSTRAFTKRAQLSPVSGPGMETVRAATAAGRPLIFVTGHFGNFNAARVAMVHQGIDLGGFYRPLSNRYFNRHYSRAMTSLSQPMFEQGKRGMVQMVKHLRGGGVQAILTDLNAHDGVPLDFFGKPALTSLVTAEMALKFDAPLVPVWVSAVRTGWISMSMSKSRSRRQIRSQ